eukprot:355353-Chlamydomonas_euryale.AAC.7
MELRTNAVVREQVQAKTGGILSMHAQARTYDVQPSCRTTALFLAARGTITSTHNKQQPSVQQPQALLDLDLDFDNAAAALQLRL